MKSKICNVSCARGCVDKTPEFMNERLKMIETIDSVYRKHDSEKLETPVFELKEVYSNKRNKFDKILDIKDQGGEILAMRYDLKTSLTRYLAMYKIEKHIRISQFGNVYRKETIDNDEFRMREFFVSDFDICGPADAMLSESQCLRVACDIVSALRVNEPIVIKIGHRKLTECCLRVAANVNESQAVKMIGKLADENRRSSIQWDDAHSTIAERKVTEAMVGEFRKMVEAIGGINCELSVVIGQLTENEALGKMKEFKPVLAEMEQLDEYCKAFLSTADYSRMRLDLSLVGSRSYYTGLTFAVWMSEADKNLLSGGRYDNLIARINPKSKFKTCCTGFSLGIDQLVMHTLTKGGQGDVLSSLSSGDNDDDNDTIETLSAEINDLDVQKDAPNAPEDDNILKNVKGTIDRSPQQMLTREKVFKTIVSTFKKHNAGTIDTPVIERKAVLTGKYGEDSKLIYDLTEVDGERLSLRYDLTVPFARYLAMHPSVVEDGRSFARYQIGKVYRRDKPAMTSGRYREFYQCDYDIAGPCEEHMKQDANCLTVVHDVLRDMDLGDFRIKVNHRKFLDGLFEVCGVPAEKFKTICSTVDKLDKTPLAKVREELIEKGLATSAADKICGYVSMPPGTVDLIDRLERDEELASNASVREALGDLRVLFGHCTDIMGKLSFDLSLARGLDYYTGMIFEAVFCGFESKQQTAEAGQEELSVGSVSGGGRYDNLVNMFSATGAQIPCVGLSIGVERLMAIHERRRADSAVSGSGGGAKKPIMVMTAQKNMVEERLQLLSMLLDAGIAAVHSMKRNPKALDVFQDCGRLAIPWAVIIGEDELKEGCVKLRNIETRVEEMVPRAEIVARLRLL